MGLWRSLAGTFRIELISADTSGFLSAAANAGLELQNIRMTDPLTLTADIPRGSFQAVRALSKKRGETLKKLHDRGIYFTFRQLLSRPVLCIGLLLVLVAVLYIPTHIFFIRVEGNRSVSANEILEQAELTGIRFGAKRSYVRSERVKNALLLRMPQLQWAGVNTKGCIATIHVSEKVLSEQTESISSGICSIVAGQDGIISQVTALKGNVLCKPGQAVKEGDILISGYTDCGLSIRATGAEGEVFAQTLRSLKVVTLSEPLIRGEKVDHHTRYSIQIGKKLIKLYNDSGISDTRCVKMYSQKPLTLPGGFSLPVTLITERIICYKTEQCDQDCGQAHWLDTFAQNYLETQMVAGRILNKSEELTTRPGIILLSGRYSCLEMIGKLKNEEIITHNGQND